MYTDTKKDMTRIHLIIIIMDLFWLKPNHQANNRCEWNKFCAWPNGICITFVHFTPMSTFNAWRISNDTKICKTRDLI